MAGKDERKSRSKVKKDNSSPRVKKSREIHGTRSVPIEGYVVERLAAYQKAKGLKSRTAAINQLLELQGY